MNDEKRSPLHLRRILATAAGLGLTVTGLFAGDPQSPAEPFREVRDKIIRLVKEKKAPSVSLKIRENRLTGEAHAIASDMSYSFPPFLTLHRLIERL